MLFSACGDSSLICLNARTGEPLYRTPVAKAGAKGGINASVVEYKGNNHRHSHEREYRHERSRAAWLRRSRNSRGMVKPVSPFVPQVIDNKELEQWRNPNGSLASSPVLVDDRLYEPKWTKPATLSRSMPPTARCSGRRSSASRNGRAASVLCRWQTLCGHVYRRGGEQGWEGGGGGEETVGNGELFGSSNPATRTRKSSAARCSPASATARPSVTTASSTSRRRRSSIASARRCKNPGFKGRAASKPESRGRPRGEKKKLQIVPYEEIFLNPGQSQSRLPHPRPRRERLHRR